MTTRVMSCCVNYLSVVLFAKECDCPRRASVVKSETNKNTNNLKVDPPSL